MNSTGPQGACLENRPGKYCSDVNMEIHLMLTPSCIPSVMEQNFPLYLYTHASLSNSNYVFSQNFLVSP